MDVNPVPQQRSIVYRPSVATTRTSGNTCRNRGLGFINFNSVKLIESSKATVTQTSKKLHTISQGSYDMSQKAYHTNNTFLFVIYSTGIFKSRAVREKNDTSLVFASYSIQLVACS